MNYHTLSLDDRILVAETLDMVRRTRQIAYNAMQTVPEMLSVFEELDRTHMNLCKQIGTDPRPVFVSADYIKERIAAGDQLYTEVYGK